MRLAYSVAHAQQIDAARLHVTHKKRAGRGPPPGPPSSAEREGKIHGWSTLSAHSPPMFCPATVLGPAPPHGATELVADPTMISPVFVSTPGRQPSIVQPPTETLSKNMFF